MFYSVERSNEEIEDTINECSMLEEEGRTKFPGMTYEQGVKAGIDWVTGQSDEHPLDE